MVRFMTGAALACALTVTAASMTAAQEKTVMVGGAAMFRSRDIIDNAVNSKDHTTLVAAVKAAGLVDTLKDEKGGMATITIPDVMQSNGVIHVISSVAMSK